MPGKRKQARKSAPKRAKPEKREAAAPREKGEISTQQREAEKTWGEIKEPCPYLKLPPGERKEALGIDGFCGHMLNGASLRSIARWLQIDPAPLLRWLVSDQIRLTLYNEARKAQAEMWAEQILEIASEPVPTDVFGRLDSAAVNDKRLRVDALKWIASKRHPAAYGERVAIDQPPPRELPPEVAVQRITFLLKKANVAVLQAVGGVGDAARLEPPQ